MFKPYFGDTSLRARRRLTLLVGALLGMGAFNLCSAATVPSSPMNVNPPAQRTAKVLAGGYGTGGVVRFGDGGVSSRILSAPAPTFLIRHPRLPVIYVTSEFNAGRTNLRAIRPDGTVVSTVWAGGAAPVRIEVNAAGDRLAVADYEGSVAVFALSKTGLIGRLLNRYASDSSTSRIHSAVFGPAPSNLLYVTDLGDDKVFVFDLGSSHNELRLVQTFGMPDGSGPRQIVFTGKVAYVASELDAHIDVLRVGPKGLLEAVSRVPIEPVGATAELVLDPSGRWLIALMRTPDACVVFSVKGESLTPHSTHACGRAPRFATFGSPETGQSGATTVSTGGSVGGSAGSTKQQAATNLWVAAQKSDEVLALPFDSTTGTLGAAVLVGSAKGAAGLVVETMTTLPG